VQGQERRDGGNDVAGKEQAYLCCPIQDCVTEQRRIEIVAGKRMCDIIKP